MRSVMPLVRRSNKSNSSSLDGDLPASDAYGGSPRRKGMDPGLVLFLLCGVVAIVFAVTQSLETAKVKNDGIKQSLDEGVVMTLEMNRENQKFVTLGPHKARVAITKTACPKPRLWMRLVGDALVSIPLDPENDDTSRWSASFSFPIEGQYALEVRWYGCDETTSEFSGLEHPILFRVKGGDSEGRLQTSRAFSSDVPDLFPPGFWASKKKFINGKTINAPYVWFSEDKKGTLPSATPKLQSETVLGKSTVASEGNPISNGFDGLSNYELLCWVGSTSAAMTREAFLSLREQINAEQRPFKFHYYPLNDFTRPDKDWEGKKGGFRKCKNVVISVDELAANITQTDYKKQVSYFINEVLQCLHDETFPIWMLTVNNPPMEPSTMCSSPLKHSHNHPCNDALFDLFNEKKKNFPAQVRLLDNTDLSDPHFDENLKDIHSTIAMRLFALAAYQVDRWREMDQKGIKDGLMRNGTLEPNQIQEDYQFEAFS